jgi:hypothetical protein
MENTIRDEVNERHKPPGIKSYIRIVDDEGISRSPWFFPELSQKRREDGCK